MPVGVALRGDSEDSILYKVIQNISDMTHPGSEIQDSQYQIQDFPDGEGQGGGKPKGGEPTYYLTALFTKPPEKIGPRKGAVKRTRNMNWQVVQVIGWTWFLSSAKVHSL